MTMYGLNDLDKWVDKVGLNTEKAVRIAALKIGSDIVQRTPVDTGRARSNWNFNLNRPDLSTASTLNPNRSVRLYDVPKAKIGDSIVISNNLDYILGLEHGHSKQAPSGMVGLAVQGFQKYIDDAVQEVGE